MAGPKASVAKEAKTLDRKSQYYIAEAGVGTNIVGDPVDVSIYSDKKLARLIEQGKVSTEEPEEEEVPPTDAADAELEPARRSGEATGQPDPDASGEPGTGATRGRPKNS